MTDERKDLPPVTSPNFLEKVREALSTYLGTRGDALDRGLTVRDVAESGLAQIDPYYLRNRGRINPIAGAGQSVIDAAYVEDLTPPPTPSGFAATAAISNLLVECDAPVYTAGNGHAKARLYGATWVIGEVPVFADAVVVSEFSGTVASHATNPSTTWHLWLTWVTQDGVESTSPAGGTNGIVVTTGQDVAALLSALEGRLTESQLYADLGKRIALIDGPSSLANSVASRIAAESSARIAAIHSETNARVAAIVAEASNRTTAVESLQSQFNLLIAAGAGDFGDLMAVLQAEQAARTAGDMAEATQRTALVAQVTEQDQLNELDRLGNVVLHTAGKIFTQASVISEATARTSATDALAQQITTVQASLGDQVAAVQTSTTATANTVNGLSAQYTVKVQAGTNYVSGFGLASTLKDGVPTSEFAVRADCFSIAPVQTSHAGNDESPFFYRTTSTTINGVVIPPGAYLKSAYIHDASITTAKIANLAVDNAKIANLDVSKLTAGSLSVGSYIQSSNFVSGFTGWRIHGNGTPEFNNAVVRGTIYATAGEFTGKVKASQFMTGAYSGWAGSGAGSYGSYLGPEGLLVGNSINGNYFQVTAAGNVYAPQFSVVNGAASFSGSLSVKSAASGARTEITNQVIKVFDSNGVLRVRIGDLSA